MLIEFLTVFGWGTRMVQFPREILVTAVLFIWVCGSSNSVRAKDAGPYLTPTAVHLVENVVITDHELELRSQDELKRLYATGRIFPLTHARPPINRPDIAPDDIASLTARSRERVENAMVFFEAYPEGQGFEDLSSDEQALWREHFRRGVADGLLIVGALGTETDAAQLLSLAIAQSGAILRERLRALVHSAVAIYSRNGLSNIDVSEFIDVLETSAPRAVLEEFILETARYGHRPSVSFLTEQVARDRNEQGWSSGFVSSALPILYAIESEETLRLALDIVSDYAASMEAREKGTPVDGTVMNLSLRHVFWDAYKYAAIFASGPDRAQLNLGLLPSFQLYTLAPVFKEPLGLMDHYYGVGRGDPQPLHISSHSYFICSMLKARSAPEASGLLDQIHAYLLGWYAHFDSRATIAQRLPSYILEAARAHCSISPTAVRIYDWAANDDPSVSLPPYIAAAARSPEYYVDLHISRGVGSYFALDSLENYSLEELAGLAAQAQNDEVQSYLERRRLVSVSVHDHLNFGAGLDNQKMWMTGFRSKGGPEHSPVWVALRLTAALRETPDRALIGLAFQTAVHAENGLAATISGDLDAVNLLLAAGGRNLIANVQVRTPDGSAKLEFAQSTAAGQHIFKLDRSKRQQRGILDIYFHDDLGIDPVSVPLFATAASFAENYSDHGTGQ